MFRNLKWEKTVVTDIGSNLLYCVLTYAVLCLVAIVMTVMNIITDKGFLTIATGIFAFFCLLNIVVSFFGPAWVKVGKVMFGIEVLVMFTFFLISGNPDGFSAIWICLLPLLGMVFFNREKGLGICGVMLLILIFLLWTPFGQTLLRYDYNETFRMRFPVLFVAFTAVAYMMETLRRNADNEMKRMQHDLEIRAQHDQLTGAFNRQGMYTALEKNELLKNSLILGAAIFDIDNFKSVNDTYGHSVGDTVLKQIAKLAMEVPDTVLCRWGGEEFVLVYDAERTLMTELEELRIRIAETVFEAERKKFSVTVSIGVFATYDMTVKQVDRLITSADKALYKAKNTGKNKIVSFTGE